MTGIIFAPELYKKKRARISGHTPGRDAYLREHQGVCAAIIADALGVSEGFIIAYQRRLGLRKCTPSGKISLRKDA